MSLQQEWLQAQLAASVVRWKIVYYHHAPYCSGTTHGSTLEMRWPFARWGADTVLSGHEHNYERLSYEGIPYFVNGPGGRSLHYFATPLPGSIIRYNSEYGAQKVIVKHIDEHLLYKPPPPNNAPVFSTDTITGTEAIEYMAYQGSVARYAYGPDEDSLAFSIISG